MGSNLGKPEPAFTAHVDDAFSSLEALFTAGEAVRVLVESTGWAHVVRVLQAEIATIDRRLDGGLKPLDQAEYALLHGRRGGLKGALDAAEAVLYRAASAHEYQRAKHEDVPVGAGAGR